MPTSAAASASSLVTSQIKPDEVQWKYFYVDADGEIKCKTEESEVPKLVKADGSEIERNKVALLTTSLFIHGSKATDAIARIKLITENALTFGGRPSEFCVALPYQERHYEETYAADLSAVSEEDRDYTDIVMHDVFYRPPDDSCGFGYVSPKRGAAQIASAIEHGYDIHAMAGIAQMPQKLELVRDHFRVNPLPTDHKKRLFVGFSDGSESQFGLHELVEYVHSGMAGRVFVHIDGVFVEPVEAESVEEIISFFESREDSAVRIKRDLVCEDEETALAVEKRFADARASGEELRSITYFPGQMISASNSPYRPDFAGQRLMVHVEGYLQDRSKGNVHEALYCALVNGVIKPEQVVSIVVEDIILEEEVFNIPRVNGLVPDFDKLTPKHHEKILNIVKKSGELTDELNEEEKRTAVESFIEKVNATYIAEAERIKQVGKEFGIPVIFGGEKRAGHSARFVSQPASVEDLVRSGDRGLELSSVARRDNLVSPIAEKFSLRTITPTDWAITFDSPIEAELYVAGSGVAGDVVRTVRSNPFKWFGYDKGVVAVDKKEVAGFDEIISKLELEPVNDSARALVTESTESEIVIGNITNISERSYEELEGKGLVCVCSGRVHYQTADIMRFINSGRAGPCDIIPKEDALKVPFIVIAPHDSSFNLEIALKPINEFGVEVPVFCAKSEVKELAAIGLSEQKVDLRSLGITPGSAAAQASAGSAAVVAESKPKGRE